MVKEPNVITVATVEKNQYGDLKVTDTLGNEYKVGNKRDHLFELFAEGRAIKLIWDNYKGKDYISDAELFDGKPPVQKQIEPIKAGVDQPPKRTISGEEIGMWWKECGEMLRAGDIDKTHPMYHDFRNAYYRKMSEVLGVPIRHKGD